MIFGFGRFLGRFFGFCTEKLRVFGFGVSYGFGFFLFLAFGFWFLAKIQAVFRLWDPMQFSVSGFWFPQSRARAARHLT